MSSATPLIDQHSSATTAKRTGYTAKISLRPDLQWRSDANYKILSSSNIVNKLQQLLAIPVMIVGIAYGIAVSILFAPGFFIGMKRVGKFVKKDDLATDSTNTQNHLKSDNISCSTTEGNSSSTAISVVWMRAEAANYGFGTDYFAWTIMRELSFVPQAPGWMKYYSRMLMPMYELVFKLTRCCFADTLARRSRGGKFGNIGCLHARTCFLDDVVEAFLDNNSNIKEGKQLVILGAGYDTRCHRFGEKFLKQQCGSNNEKPVLFEVDAPGTHKAKIRLMNKIGKGPDSSIVDSTQNVHKKITYVSCDFENESWIDVLVKNGFDKTKPACFIWEGVTMYLPEVAVKETLKLVKENCVIGSVIAFDYHSYDFVWDVQMQIMMKRIGEEWKWGLNNDGMEEFVEGVNKSIESNAVQDNSSKTRQIKIVDHLKPADMLERYCPKRPGNGGSYVGFLGEKYGGMCCVGVV